MLSDTGKKSPGNEPIIKYDDFLNSLNLNRPMICQLFEAKSVCDFSTLNQKAKEIFESNSSATIDFPLGYNLPKCYLCFERITKLHWFYHQLCPKCGDVSLRLRFLSCDLSGKRCIVTGGRIKLGYQIALKLLRAGAEVVVTSRTPSEFLWKQYESEPDSKNWFHHLHICPLSLDMIRIDQWIDDFDKYLSNLWPDQKIDILINNAALTITGSKQPKFDKDTIQIHPMPEKSFANSWPPIHFFPEQFGEVPMIDKYGDVLDLRTENSWTTPFGKVDANEAKDILLANTWAPFVLTQRLWNKLSNDAFVVNVHAKEGLFGAHKTINHPHTNLAQAGFCMLTRILSTYGGHNDFSQDLTQLYPHVTRLPWNLRFSKSFKIADSNVTEGGARLTSTTCVTVHGVDPGWFSIGEYTRDYRRAHHILSSPIDEIDAASRIVHVIFNNIRPSFMGTWKHYIPLTTF